MTEEQLEGVWIVDPIKKTRLAAATWHFEKHKAALEATTLEQYVRQAISFREEAKRRNGSGKPVVGRTPGVRKLDEVGAVYSPCPKQRDCFVWSRQLRLKCHFIPVKFLQTR